MPESGQLESGGAVRGGRDGRRGAGRIHETVPTKVGSCTAREEGDGEAARPLTFPSPAKEAASIYCSKVESVEFPPRDICVRLKIVRGLERGIVPLQPVVWNVYFFNKRWRPTI